MTDEIPSVAPERPGGERRVDLPTRRRVVAIERQVQMVARRSLLGIIWVSAAVLLMGLGFVYLLDQVQESRLDSAETACINRNDDRQALYDYIDTNGRQLSRAPAFKELPQEQQDFFTEQFAGRSDQVRLAFPKVENCRRYAHELVD